MPLDQSNEAIGLKTSRRSNVHGARDVTRPPSPDVGSTDLVYAYPTQAIAAIAFSRSISAYVSVTAGEVWPRTTRATSSPNSFRRFVAALCLNWWGCQFGTPARLQP